MAYLGNTSLSVTTDTFLGNVRQIDSVTVGSTPIAFGATATTITGLSSVTSTSFVGALTGNASTAATLQTARTIGGVSFNGSANINLPGVNTAGNQNTTGSAATLTTARTINGVSFNGSGNITITAASPQTLTRGTGLTGDNYDGSVARTFAVSYGTSAGTACQGNDARLTDARQATNTNTQLASLGVGTAASGTTGEIRATNNITAFFSDIRLKDKQGVITNALEKVSSLEGFYYKPNDIAKKYGYTNDKTEVGISAQDIAKILPEVVEIAPFDSGFTEDGKIYSLSVENYLTVHYYIIVPILIESIKELKTEIEQLKSIKRNNDTI
jgi:hypothetical protein